MSYEPEIFDEPSSESPWFLYDQMDYRFYYFRTEVEALDYFAREVRPLYREEGSDRYADEIAWVTIGKITHVVESPDCNSAHLTEL